MNDERAARTAIILEAISHSNGGWPDQLDSGIMFFKGQRITRAEFEACEAAPLDFKAAGIARTGETGEIIDRRAGERRAAAPVDKLLTIIAYAYQVAGAHDVPDHILDVLADPEEATAEQIDTMLPYVPAAPVVAVVAANLTEIVERYLTHGVLGDMPNHRQQLLSLAADAQALASQAQAAVSAPAALSEAITLLETAVSLGHTVRWQKCRRDFLAAQAAVGVASQQEQQPQPSCMPPTRGTGLRGSAGDPAWRSMTEKAIAVLQRHIVPNGISDNEALSELYGIFDSEEYRSTGTHPQHDCDQRQAQAMREDQQVASMMAVGKASSASPDLASIASQAQGPTEWKEGMLARRWCAGDNAWSQWSLVSESDYAKWCTDSSFQFDTNCTVSDFTPYQG